MRLGRSTNAILVLLAVSLIACNASGSGPTTWLDRPLDGDQVGLELVTIQAHASDAGGVSKFEFLINDTLLSSAAASGTRFGQAAVEWVPPAPGTYVVRARSINGAGAVGSEARAVIVVSPPPVTVTPTATSTATATATPSPRVDITVTPKPITITPSINDVTITPKPACPGVPVISAFSANPGTITAGEGSVLSWGPIKNADSAVINQGVGRAEVNGGSIPIKPATSTTYVLTATGCGGTVVQSVTITVQPPAPVCPGPPSIASFSANPSTITAGQSTTLSWGAVTNATSASIDPGVGGVGTPGSIVVSPAGTTTYTLTASGCGGTVRRQVTVNVNAAPPPPPPPPPPPADTTPPTISNVSVSPTMISQAGCGSTIRSTVSATVTDASGIDRVVARLAGVGGGEVGMSAAGGNSYRTDIGPFNAPGQVVVRVVAWDKAGNLAQSGSTTVNIVCIK